jgi:hypothetical protein
MHGDDWVQDTYDQEKEGRTAASLRMMNHNTLVMPIKGPSMWLVMAAIYPRAMEDIVPMAIKGSLRWYCVGLAM